MSLGRCLGKGWRGGWTRWILDASEAAVINEGPDGGMGFFRKLNEGTGDLVLS